MKEIKKCLMTDRLKLSLHARKQMYKRGYTKSDIIACIMNGSILEKQVHHRRLKVIVEGEDTDQLPIALVIGKGYHPRQLEVVTVMPPMTTKFNRVI